jgi:predicted O-methyltransferase YrrM
MPPNPFRRNGLAQVLRAKARAAFPSAPFYSPIVDAAAVAARRDAIWPHRPRAEGIDFNDEGHRRVLGELFPRFIGNYDYPEHRKGDADEASFYTQNSQFSWLDARALFVLLRAYPPRRIVEVGAGYSTILMADVNHRFLEDRVSIRCIDPYPPAFLHKLRGIDIVEHEVQGVSLDIFAALEAGDVLFIDSSHVAKTGSDVNFLYFDVLPVLNRGVRIHVHDIFLPGDYPPEWVMDENRSWNEQYVVRALLMYSTAFRVEFGSSYAFHAHLPLVRHALAHPKGHAFGGGSLWLTKAIAPGT